MKDVKITVASLRSVLNDTAANLELARQTCTRAAADGARLVVMPELMLTGHGGHPKMAANAEPAPDGPLGRAVLEMSAEHDLCVCVGMAELDRGIVYNSQIVADRGAYLGRQRKMNLSGDEYAHFGAGEAVEVFDIGDVRFGISICYDNGFPEMALLHSLDGVDLILAPHAARSGVWPDDPSDEFLADEIRKRQGYWERTGRTRAVDHNVYVLFNNAVGSSTEGLEGVVANHAGTVMGVDPTGEVFLRTEATGMDDEVVTVELKADKRRRNHNETRNRRLETVVRLLSERLP